MVIAKAIHPPPSMYFRSVLLLLFNNVDKRGCIEASCWFIVPPAKIFSWKYSKYFLRGKIKIKYVYKNINTR